MCIDNNQHDKIQVIILLLFSLPKIINNSELCSFHEEQKKQRKLRQRKKKKEIRLAQKIASKRKRETDELFLWEQTQKRFKELQRTWDDKFIIPQSEQSSA